MAELNPIQLSEVHDAAREVVLELAPAERFGFEGIWSDTIRDVGTSWQDTEAPAFMVPAQEVHLISAVVIPAALWLAKKMAEGAVSSAVDALKDWLRHQLGLHPKTSAGELSDADLERIANAVAKRLKHRH